MTFDLYAWQSPRDIDADAAGELVQHWLDAGGDPSTSPFEPSTDVGWFYRELMKDEPGLDATSDAVPNPSKLPIWLSTESEPPARVVAIRLSAGASDDAVGTIYSLAMKYDLVLYDPYSRRVRHPLEEMTVHASATFWPAGAIQAGVAGGAGGLVAVAAWILGIPILSGLVALAGGFMFVIAVYSYIHEGRKALAARRTRGESPPQG